MPASKAQQKAVTKYMKENYDEIKVRVEKGRKAIIQAHAEAQGESVNGFINRAIGNQISQDRRKGLPEAPESMEGHGVALHSEREKTQKTAQNSVTAKED